MGAFSGDPTVRGSDEKTVVRVFSARKAFVTAGRNGNIVGFDKESDAQKQRGIAKLGALLSASPQSTLHTVLNCDSDILWYRLYECGGLNDGFNSTHNDWSLRLKTTMLGCCTQLIAREASKSALLVLYRHIESVNDKHVDWVFFLLQLRS
jgi:hypothetical protein